MSAHGSNGAFSALSFSLPGHSTHRDPYFDPFQLKPPPTPNPKNNIHLTLSLLFLCVYRCQCLSCPALHLPRNASALSAPFYIKLQPANTGNDGIPPQQDSPSELPSFVSPGLSRALPLTYRSRCRPLYRPRSMDRWLHILRLTRQHNPRVSCRPGIRQHWPLRHC